MPPLFQKIKNHVLGKNYDLSVAFLSAVQMKKITKKYKHINHASNVLSFPLSKNSGEILLCRAAAKPFSINYLFIHGLLHLKGLRHGATMEQEEQKLLARFVYAKNSNRSRHRHLPSKGRHSAAQ